MAHVITPRRDEQLLQGGRASLRYIKFFEDIATNVNSGDDTDSSIIISGSTYTTTGNGNIICTAVTTITLA